MTFPVGTLVFTYEHPDSIGEVIRTNDDGDLFIRFTTAPCKNLPFGHSNLEIWRVAEHHLLELYTGPTDRQ